MLTPGEVQTHTDLFSSLWSCTSVLWAIFSLAVLRQLTHNALKSHKVYAPSGTSSVWEQYSSQGVCVCVCVSLFTNWLHYMTKCINTNITQNFDCKTPPSKAIGIIKLPQQPPLFWFQSLVRGCRDLIPFSHNSIGKALLFGDKAWLTVGVPVHPMVVWCVWGQGFEQES